MKALFWILLLGNAVFFAAMQWGGPLVAGSAPVQAQPPLHEEKIKLLSAPPAKPAPPSIPAHTIAAPIPASAPVPASAPAALLAGQTDIRCMEWSDFSGTDLTRATAALSPLQLGDKLSQREIEYAIGYWVYMPPMKDKAAVNQKIAQLKARGITEYFVVSEPGQWLNAISLGVFKTPEAARHFLDDLQRNNDIRTARVGERASKLKATVFVLNGVDAKVAAELAEIQKDFAGSELKEIPCAD